jgi:hypothetical protein
MGEILRAVDFATWIPELLGRHPLVRRARLAGSRATGTTTPLSDWDFAVETDELDALAAELPELLAPLEPLAQQWDPLGERPTYMLMLHGPAKVDLIFVHQTMEERPPWRVTARTLAGLDAHFWDWILWLAAKRARGREELVRDELQKMHGFLLRPLGVADAPGTIDQALESYLRALEERERELGAEVSRTLRDEVLPAVRGAAGPTAP